MITGNCLLGILLFRMVLSLAMIHSRPDERKPCVNEIWLIRLFSIGLVGFTAFMAGLILLA